LRPVQAILRGMMRGFLALLSAALLAGCINSDEYEPHEAIDLEFNGGPVNGADYFAALHICNIVNRYSDGKYNCVTRAAPGPVANIDDVLAGAVEFGISRSDYVFQAVEGTGIWQDDPQPSLRALFTVHNNAVALVVREDSDIGSPLDLEGRIVNLGIPDSLSQKNALELLELMEIDPEEDIEPRGLLPEEAAVALADGEIDAFFLTGATPAPAIELAADLTDVRLISLSNQQVVELVTETPYYAFTDIPTGYYRPIDPLDEAFWTFSIPSYGYDATVIASAYLSEDIVNDVTGYVFRHLNEFRSGHPFFSHLDYDEMRDQLMAPLHPGAEGEWTPVDPWWVF